MIEGTCIEARQLFLVNGILEPETELHLLARLIHELAGAKTPGEEHRLLREIAQFSDRLPEPLLRSLAARALRNDHCGFRGELCYLLGRSGMPSLIPLIQPFVNDPGSWVQEQARKAIQELEQADPVVSGYPELQRQELQLEIGAWFTLPRNRAVSTLTI